jgi:ABC-type bacteriocin/lantibiotic exporter with double-glycine peptidase domain
VTSSRNVACGLALMSLLSMTVLPESYAYTKNKETYDCGTLALYTLLQLEGKQTTLRSVERSLPATPAHGYSMKQLRDAAGHFGLGLVGVRMGGKAKVPSRPFIAFLKRGEHGHFLVVRPLGHTGKMVQVLDAASEPQVLDAADFFGSSEWSGIALISTDAHWSVRIGVSCLVLSLMTSGAFYLKYRIQRAAHFQIRG